MDGIVETSGPVLCPQKVLVFGQSGVGKTSLVANIVQTGRKVKFLDLEDGSQHKDVSRITGITCWSQVRACLADESRWKGVDVVALDSMTSVDPLVSKWVVANITTDDGHSVSNIEGYGFHKGYRHICDQFLLLQSDLERHLRAGRHVVLIAHHAQADAKTVEGVTYKRWEPNLQDSDNGKFSVRKPLVAWLDTIAFIAKDVIAQEDKGVKKGEGRGRGGKTRTIYVSSEAFCESKTRLDQDIPPRQFPKGDASIWPIILGEK